MRVTLTRGKQESRTTKDEADQEFETIKQHIQKLATEDHWIILMGDFNAKLIDDLSRDGKIIKDKIIKDCNMKMINETKKCKGKYTRINTANPTEKSIDNITPNITEMETDEAEKYKLMGKNLQTTI